jgi:hypothetical protein
MDDGRDGPSREQAGEQGPIANVPVDQLELARTSGLPGDLLHVEALAVG